jgi:RNA polymerase sigma-70 factor (ECF subfamily)
MTDMTCVSIHRLTSSFREDSGAVSHENPPGDVPSADREPAADVAASAVPEVGPAVMARAVRGDDHAFATVVHHYDPLLRSFTCQFLGDTTHMDQVLSAAYVKAYRLLPAYRAETRPSTLLFRIVYNACVNAIARDHPDGSEAADPAAPEGAGVGVGEAEAGQRGQLALWLDDALAQLPPERRAAVLLVDAAGLDPASAADVLEIPVEELGHWLAAARPDLRAVIAAGGEGRRG